MLPNIDINLISVLIAAIVGMALGALWYSPLMFGNLWIKLSGMNKKDIEKAKAKGMSKAYLANFIAVIITAYVLSYLISLTQVIAIGEGILLSVMLWIGFVAPVILGSVLWEKKPVGLYILNVTYYLVQLIIMGIILVSWR